MIGKEFFDGLSGSGDCEAGRHSLVVVYGRPRRTLFCQRYALRRWPCDRWLPEPRLRGGWATASWRLAVLQG